MAAGSVEICANVGWLCGQRQVHCVPGAVESVVGVGRDGVEHWREIVLLGSMVGDELERLPQAVGVVRLLTRTRAISCRAMTASNHYM